MNFAKNLLGKYGWKEGDGLGKNNDGINAALKPNYKFDKSGLGHSQADEINNHWWENVFNNAANNVDVIETAGGEVAMARKTGKSIEITTKNYSIHAKADTYYKGQFLKTSTLINSSKEVRDGKGGGGDDETVIFESVTQNPFKVVSDEDLFKACNGRTAHKGARHGIKMSGKLSRIEAQERELLAKMNHTAAIETKTKPITTDDADWTKVTKRKHSRKNKIPEAESVHVDSVSVELFTNEYHTTSKKKQKKNRRTDAELSDALAAISTANQQDTDEATAGDHTDSLPKTKTIKSKRPKVETQASVVADGAKVKKSHKRKHSEFVEASIAEISEYTNEKKSKKGKHQDIVAPACANDFLKTPNVTLTEKQEAKLERKRQRQMKRLQIDS